MSSEIVPVPQIRRLPEQVVNKIAAGEIIQRPSNALKEILENAIDAGSTNIQVLVKDGGLKLLQIQDNGHGIRREDLDLVCERFTTSKLRHFEDLQQIQTFGFRGEALASISHVARLTITTRTKDSPVAWRTLYSDGKPVEGPKPCAANPGTQITVEDLFFNVPTRKGAFSSTSEEYTRILEVIQRYSLRYPQISFSCKKAAPNSVPDLITPSNSTTIDNIRLVFTNAIAKELLALTEETQYECSINGFVSSPNFNLKRACFVFFINGRLVDCAPIKKALEAVYCMYLPKGTYPFVYLSLEIKRQHVDVNIHPTKREVRFLHQDAIVEWIVVKCNDTLKAANQSRTFLTQILLPGASEPLPEKSIESTPQKVHVSKLVRTDSKSTTLDHFISPSLQRNLSSSQPAIESDPASQTSVSQSQEREFVQVQLESVLELRQEVMERIDSTLVELLQNHTFLGCIDETRALIQHSTRLYIVNYQDISYELFYCLGLKAFANFGRLHMTPVSVYDAVLLALKSQDLDDYQGIQMTKEEISEEITALVCSKADMLLEYFSLGIENGSVFCLPNVLRSYSPDLSCLPQFLLRLGTQVDWNDEKRCFETFLQELALFYATRTIFDSETEQMVRNIVFPAVKKWCPASTQLNSSLQAIANLPDLYKVFERC